MFKYYREFVCVAWKDTVLFLDITSRKKIVRVVLLWLLSVVPIYLLSGFKGIFGYLSPMIYPAILIPPIVFIIFFLFVAPAKVARKYNDKYESSINLIDKIYDPEEKLRYLSELYKEGITIYDKSAVSKPATDWIQEMESWDKKVNEYNNFSISCSHIFNKPGDCSYRSMLKFCYPIDNECGKMLSKYSHKIEALDEFISYSNEHGYIGKDILNKIKSLKNTS
jgi:hypothetical protein